MKQFEEENHFDRLPDALLLLIFNKLLNLKNLIRCSFVSKRFASLIPQTDSVLIQISPTHAAGAAGFFKNFITNIVAKLVQPWAPISRSLDHVQFSALSVLNKKFREIKSLQIELHCPDGKSDVAHGDGPLIKWKAVFGSHLEVCVILFAINFYKTSRFNAFLEQPPILSHRVEELGEDELKSLRKLTKLCLMEASKRQDHVLRRTRIVSDQPELRSVMVSDHFGKLCMGEEEVEKLRSCMNSSVELHSPKECFTGPLCLKLWYVPVLDLHSSGYVMRRAVLAAVRRNYHSVVMERDVKLILGAFDDKEEGKVYNEAVMKILDDDNKKYYVSQIPYL